MLYNWLTFQLLMWLIFALLVTLSTKVLFEKYIDFTEVQVFEGATTYPVILVARNTPEFKEYFSYVKVAKHLQNSFIDIDSIDLVNVSQSSLNLMSWNFHSINENKLLNKIIKFKSVKEQFGKCFRGIVTGFNDAFIVDKKTKNKLENAHNSSKELIKPFFEGKDLSKWNSSDKSKFIIFTRRGTEIDKFPAIKQYLETNRERLTPKNSPDIKIGRKAGPYKWFEIQDSVDYYKTFESAKITWPNLQSGNKFSLDLSGYYINAPSVVLPSGNKVLLSILNSKITWFFLKSVCVMRSGGYIEVKPQYFEQIPIPDFTENKKLDEATNHIINLTKDFQQKNQRFIKRTKDTFDIQKTSKKLNSFYDFDFKTFLAELKKQKITLSLHQQDEWEDYFTTYKTEINHLQTQITQTDNEIDQMVYALYGLTDAEIAIVEGG